MKQRQQHYKQLITTASVHLQFVENLPAAKGASKAPPPPLHTHTHTQACRCLVVIIGHRNCLFDASVPKMSVPIDLFLKLFPALVCPTPAQEWSAYGLRETTFVAHILSYVVASLRPVLMLSIGTPTTKNYFFFRSEGVKPFLLFHIKVCH